MTQTRHASPILRRFERLLAGARFAVAGAMGGLAVVHTFGLGAQLADIGMLAGGALLLGLAIVFRAA